MGINVIAGAQTVLPAMSRVVRAKINGKKGHDGLPTDDPTYRETLNLLRQVLVFTSVSTVEEVQDITESSIARIGSAIITEVIIPESFYPIAATHIQSNLGPKNLELIGKSWWQWRIPGNYVKAEWVEMKSDFLERKAINQPCKKVIFYLHGGAYYFGGMSHGPQLQRHARKLKGKVFAPRYRLAPQFPFPCAIQDILSAYLYLLTIHDASQIVISGDSAGGGLCVALLLILRDEGIPLPAGASLISPWVDLTHSFPSIRMPTDFDYVPAHGFHAKPSISWPPPNSEEMINLGWSIHPGAQPDFEVEMDGKITPLTEQFQLYAQNNHLQIPLVSGILAPSLGGLCPIQVIVGGGEVLRDEQIYLAHKAANPSQYPPSDFVLENNGNTLADVTKYPPTDVQLLVFDNGPHVATLLGHTPLAKYQFRSISQFAAWALSKAQKVDIEIEDDDTTGGEADIFGDQIGNAGGPMPQFVDHMVRCRVDSFGRLFPLKPANELRACNYPTEKIGLPSEISLQGWLTHRKKSDMKYASEKKKIFQQRMKYSKIGYIQDFPDGEVAPPTALAGRRVIGEEIKKQNPKGGVRKNLMEKMFRMPHQHDQPYENAKSGDHEKNLVAEEQIPRKTKRVSYMPPTYEEAQDTQETQETQEISVGMESKRDGWI